MTQRKYLSSYRQDAKETQEEEKLEKNCTTGSSGHRGTAAKVDSLGPGA